MSSSLTRKQGRLCTLRPCSLQRILVTSTRPMSSYRFTNQALETPSLLPRLSEHRYVVYVCSAVFFIFHIRPFFRSVILDLSEAALYNWLSQNLSRHPGNRILTLCLEPLGLLSIPKQKNAASLLTFSNRNNLRHELKWWCLIIRLIRVWQSGVIKNHQSPFWKIENHLLPFVKRLTAFPKRLMFCLWFHLKLVLGSSVTWAPNTLYLILNLFLSTSSLVIELDI